MDKQLLIIAVLALLLHSGCFAEDKDPVTFSTDDCHLIDPIYGSQFDFSALHSDIAKVAKGAKDDIFQYNICGNLSGSCDGKSNVAACLKKDGKEYILGTKHQLTYNNGKMYFNFSGGAKCPSHDEELKLLVILSCDYTWDSVPSRVTPYANDACQFYITLETPHACLPAPEAVKSNGCSVQDPASGHTYDLLSLSDFNYRTVDRSGNVFVINICKPVLYGQSAMCPIGSSVCFIQLNSTDYKKRFFNYGSVQANPMIENGKLIMRHPSTTTCNDTDNYSSTIHFICDKETRSPRVSLIGVNGCLYEFSFSTPLACNDLPPCTIIKPNNEILDMRPLQGNAYTLEMSSKKYTFAVCSNPGETCLNNDGACISQDGQATSIGKFNSELHFNRSGSAYLLYTDGAVCKDQTKWSTKIEFVCAHNYTKDNATFGSSTANGDTANSNNALGPHIIENKNCQLLVHFQTPLACQNQITCKVETVVEHSEDGTGKEIIDLTPLISTTDNYEAKINTASITEQQVPKSTKFFLNVCRPLVPKYGLGCPGGSAACMARVDSSSPTPEEEQSLGFPMVSLIAYNRTTAELRYLEGSTCPTDNKTQLSSGIVFYCDMRAGLGAPMLQMISDCHYQFEWATNVICPTHMCIFNEKTCEITNEDMDSVSYNLKKANFAESGKIKILNGNTEFTLDFCGSQAKAETVYSQGLVNLFFSANAPCGKSNVQLRLICSANTTRDTNYSDSSKECNLVVVQHTPDICKFLGLAVPTQASNNNNDSSSPTTVTTTTTSATPADDKNNGDSGSKASSGTHPAEQTGSVGAILATILSVTCFMACVGVFALSPERRNSVRRFFRRTTSAVRYSRVQSNEEANLLLEPNGEFTESDDDMLL